MRKGTLVAAICVVLVGCGGGGGGGETNNQPQPPANNAPSIAPVADITVDEGQDVTISAEATDPDGDALTYEWTLKSGPPGWQLNTENSSSISFVSPEVKATETIELSLKVTDTGGLTATTDINIFVNSVNKGPSLTNVSASTSYPRSLTPAQEIEALEYSAVRIRANISPDDFEVTEANLQQISGRPARLVKSLYPDLLPIELGRGPAFEFDVFLPEVDSGGDVVKFELVAIDSDEKQASAIITVDVINIERGSGKLNDTGLVDCIGEDDRTTDCANVPASLGGQDAQIGLDTQFPDGSDGRAGFSFTKLDEFGSPMSASSQNWSCVKDERTGLIWEAKKQEGGLHHYDSRYKWRNLDAGTNGNFQRNTNYDAYDESYCEGSDCFTDSFVAAVNEERLCGRSDWRVPEIYELLSLLDFNHQSSPIDKNYFPQFDWEVPEVSWSAAGLYWSATPVMTNAQGYEVWNFTLSGSQSKTYVRNGEVARVILVSGGI